jgi:protein disulfide-isomerase A6
VLVAFVAPWCGHSRSLAPPYAAVAAHFAAAFPGQTPHVRIARVDASVEPELAAAHGVDGYPTLKWYPSAAAAVDPPQTLDPGSYAGAHAAATLAADVEARAGLVGQISSRRAPGYRAYRAPQPAVQALSAATFDAVAHDPARAVLVLFQAPWCTPCATLAPIYERVAKAFADDADRIAVCSVPSHTAEQHNARLFHRRLAHELASPQRCSTWHPGEAHEVCVVFALSSRFHRPLCGGLGGRRARARPRDALRR